MEETLSPIALWKDIDSLSMPLNTAILSEKEENGICFREVYFSGTHADDGKTRIYGIYAFPKGQKNLPALLFAGEEDASIDLEQLKYFAGLGYAVLGFDYCGKSESRPRFTIYPPSMENANYQNAQKYLFSTTPEIANSFWMIWAGQAKRALSQLAAFEETDPDNMGMVGLRLGTDMAWKLAAIEPRIKCAAALLSKNWIGRSVFYSDKSIDLEKETSKWAALVSTQAYAQHIKIPFYVFNCTNERTGSFDTVYSNYSRMPMLKGQYISITERQDAQIGFRQKDNLKKFLDTVLKHRGDFVEKPDLSCKESEDKLRFVLKADSAAVVQNAEIFYCASVKEAAFRNWHSLKLVPTGQNEYIADAEIGQLDKYFLAFATVSYAEGMSISSRLIAKTPQQLNIKKQTLKQSRLIYDDSMGKDCFLVSDAPKIFESEPIAFEEGPFQICGIKANFGNLTTYKTGDYYFCSDEGSLILSLYLAQSGVVEFVLSGVEGEQTTYYSCAVAVDGMEKWQKLTLEKGSFKTKEGLPLESWIDTPCLKIISKGKMLLGSMLWA